MKIKCLGAVQTVTGSCFQIIKPDGKVVLLDCGLFQGGNQTESRNYETHLYQPQAVDAIVLTHAHMDHSGLVPRLVKAGYRGPVYATPPTCDLLKVLWDDAANIQEHEALWKTRKNKRQGGKAIEPLYNGDDAAMAHSLLQPIEFYKPREVSSGLEVQYVEAGHILGAASAHFTMRMGDQRRQVVFSGDLGRTGQLLMPDPHTPPRADMIFMETTYGNRSHKSLTDSVNEFIAAINDGYKKGGKILIPTFAVERTQEILLILTQAWHEKKIPQDIPIIIDSPLAIATSEIYQNYTSYFDDDAKKMLAKGFTPQNIPGFRVTRGAEESQKLNDIAGPAIIMAGSGMANAGRILHHLKHNLWRETTQVIFVGFQAQGTTGRRLVELADQNKVKAQELETIISADKNKKPDQVATEVAKELELYKARNSVVKIFRDPVTVAANIITIGGFSGHADQNELKNWLAPQIHDGVHVNLIHGELTGTTDFMNKVKPEFSQADFTIPKWGQEIMPFGAKETMAAEPAVVQVPAAYETAPELEDATPRPRLSLIGRLGRITENVADPTLVLAPDRLSLMESLLNIVEEELMKSRRNGNGQAD